MVLDGILGLSLVPRRFMWAHLLMLLPSPTDVSLPTPTQRYQILSILIRYIKPVY